MLQHSAMFSGLRKVRYPTAAFLIPAFIRAFPELVAGRYPIGWDTISFYVPSTLDWAAGKVSPQFMLGEAPLIYGISVPLKLLSVDPVLTFKVLGPAIYGGLTFSAYRFLRSSLRWTERTSLTSAFVMALYFITLRIGWDLYRNSIGLMFVLLALSLPQDSRSPKTQFETSLLLCLSVLSDQFSAVLAIGIFGVRTLAHLYEESLDSWRDLKVLLPPILVLISILLSEVQATGLLFPRQPPIPQSWSLSEAVGFIGFAYLPIAPFALLGVRKLRNLDLSTWLLLSLVGAIGTSVPTVGLLETGYRWALLATFPICICATAWLVGLRRTTHVQTSVARRILARLPIFFIIGLALLGGFYLVSPAQATLPYFALYPSFVPTSMMQSTVPLSDYSNLFHILETVGANAQPGSALITHQAIYGWAREYLPSTVNVVNYGYGTPIQGVQMATARGYSSILLVWWVNGSGWFGQTNVPSGFTPIHTDGDMALYGYMR